MQGRFTIFWQNHLVFYNIYDIIHAYYPWIEKFTRFKERFK